MTDSTLIERIDSIVSAYTEGGKISSSMSVIKIMTDCKAALSEPVASMPQDVELNQILGEYLAEELAAVAPDIDWYDGRYMDGLVSGILDVVMAGHARVPGDMLYLLPQADALDDIWACAHSGYSVEDLKIKIEMLKGQDNE